MQVTLDPVLFYIGTFAFRWYNLILLLAVAAGLPIILLEAKRLGLPRVDAVRLYLWSIPFVAVFGRLFIIWDQWDYYSAVPSRMLSLSGARLDGAILGFVVLLLIYTVISKRNFWYLADAVTMDMAIVMALGRWACVVNGCCYGLACDLPWAVIYTNPNTRAPLDLPLHPVQLYQVIWYSATFVLLWALRRKIKPEGSLFLLFVMLYSAGDSVTRIFRNDNEFFLGLQQAHVFNVLMLAAAIPLYVWRRRQPAAETAGQGD